MTIEEQILKLVKKADPPNPVEYVQNIVRSIAIDKLNNYIIECKDCNICNCSKSITSGNANASIMIIGESVLEEQLNNDNKIVLPFVNTKEENILNKLFNAYHVNTKEIFWINAVNCFTYKEVNKKRLKRAPSKTEVNNCKIFLDYAIDTVKPILIILLGNIALNMFHKAAITQFHGQWIDIRGIPAISTYHPSYFSQLKGKKDPDLIEIDKIDFCEDIKQALLKIQKDFPDNNVLMQKLEEN